MRVVHALIGCGRVAPNHVDGFQCCPMSDLVWACDRDPQVLEAFARDYAIPKMTLDYRDVLADPHVHSVSIMVDHAQHAQLVREALCANKHVLVEKPLALDLEEARALCALAQTRERILAVVSQHRYDPLIKLVKQLLQRGDLGQLIAIWTTFQCRREAEYYTESYWRGTWAGEGGSVLINQAYHCVDVMTWLGGDVAEVQGMRATLKLGKVIETEDTLCGMVRFANGALGSLAMTSASDVFWQTRINVVGTAGSLCFDIDHPDTLHFYQVAPPVKQVIEAFLAESGGHHAPPPGKDYYGISHRYQIDEFVRAVAGGPSVTVDGFASLPTLRTILELYQTARP